MGESRGYCYDGCRYTSIKCRKCEETKPVWYFGVSEKTGDRRKICKACRARLRHKIKVDQSKRYEGIFDGLELNPLWDLNSNIVAQKMIDRRAVAVRDLIFREMQEKPKPDEVERTIADEIKAGKKAWRAIRRLAWAPIPLKLIEAD